MDYSNESLDRKDKIRKLKEAWVIVYANNYRGKENIAFVQKQEDKIKDLEILLSEWIQKDFQTAWRLMSMKSHGKLMFSKIIDNTGGLQICFMKDICEFHTGHKVVKKMLIDGEEKDAYKISEKFLNIGDYVGVKGDLFFTKHGELTLLVKEFQILSKAIRSLPEKFHGITDQETLYRQRYLDLIMNDESYQRFLLRSKFIQAIREFYIKNDFIEIETPILWNSASWAAAKPFITHHNDFWEDFFLRIAPETSLKKATVGRFEKVFEIGKNFRNEGSDPSHMQEFSVVEHYTAWWNFEDNMQFTESLFDYIFSSLKLSKIVPIKDKEWNIKEVDFTTPWERINYIQWVEEVSWINVENYGIEDEEKLRNDIQKAWYTWVGIEKQWLTTMIDYLYKKVLRPKIIGPAFIYNYPKTMQPLARQSDMDENIVEQFQVLVNGWEVIKAYSELVDPEIQKTNFDTQSWAIERGDEEATSGDDDFLLAMEYAMPPQSGFGMGLDRIFSLLTEQENLRDVVLFPLMRDENKKKIEEISLNWEDMKEERKNLQWEENNYENLKLPSIEEVMNLIDKYAPQTRQHLISVWCAMKYFAKKLGKNEQAWQLVGLLHDIDWDYIEKDGTKHCKEDLEKIVAEIHLPKELIEDIKSHWYFITNVEPNTLIRKYICSVDELTWFITAVWKMMPNKKIEEIKITSILKKVKDKAFASWVSREEIKNCEKMLGKNFEEFVEELLEGLKEYANEFGM